MLCAEIDWHKWDGLSHWDNYQQTLKKYNNEYNIYRLWKNQLGKEYNFTQLYWSISKHLQTLLMWKIIRQNDLLYRYQILSSLTKITHQMWQAVHFTHLELDSFVWGTRGRTSWGTFWCNVHMLGVVVEAGVEVEVGREFVDVWLPETETQNLWICMETSPSNSNHPAASTIPVFFIKLSLQLYYNSTWGLK